MPVRRTASSAGAARDSFALLAMLVALLGIALVSLDTRQTLWQPGAAPHAEWCEPGQTAQFQFGFADLAAELGGIAGTAIDCEHGEPWTQQTRQTTTTGVAIYDKCSNTPTFVRGAERWSLTPTGLRYWSGEGA